MVANLIRYKKDEPFSTTLNNWVNYEYFKLVSNGFLIEYTTKEYSYRYLRRLFNSKSVILISNKNCDNNIFGNIETNLKFRAIHDYVHYVYNYDFSLEGETNTFYKQLEQLNLYPNVTDFERDLLKTEIISQTLYFINKGYFPSNQRMFTINKLINK